MVQFVCGHRGVANGDRNHMKGRQGPTAESVHLLEELRRAYDQARARGDAFPVPYPVVPGIYNCTCFHLRLLLGCWVVKETGNRQSPGRLIVCALMRSRLRACVTVLVDKQRGKEM